MALMAFLEIMDFSLWVAVLKINQWSWDNADGLFAIVFLSNGPLTFKSDEFYLSTLQGFCPDLIEVDFGAFTVVEIHIDGVDVLKKVIDGEMTTTDFQVRDYSDKARLLFDYMTLRTLQGELAAFLRDMLSDLDEEMNLVGCSSQVFDESYKEVYEFQGDDVVTKLEFYCSSNFYDWGYETYVVQ